MNSRLQKTGLIVRKALVRPCSILNAEELKLSTNGEHKNWGLAKTLRYRRWVNALHPSRSDVCVVISLTGELRSSQKWR